MEISATQLIFYLLSFMIIVSSIYVVTLKNIFHSAIFLILTLFSVAGIYVMLGAEFLAASQVLIYVGPDDIRDNAHVAAGLEEDRAV